MKKPLFYVAFLSLLFISGCQTVPKDAFRLAESNLEVRKIQSRMFETKDEIELLSASISVLQDLGYQIDNTEKKLGLVTGSKEADATDTGQVVAAVLLTVLSGKAVHYDDKQHITVSVVTIPAKNNNGFYARATFQKIVWNTQGIVTKAETISNPELYNEFFDQLSKSVFLEQL